MKKINILFPKYSNLKFDNKVSKINVLYNKEWKSWGVIKYNKNGFQIGEGIWVNSKKEAMKQKKEWKTEFGI